MSPPPSSTHTVPSTSGYLTCDPPSLNPSISAVYMSGCLTPSPALFSGFSQVVSASVSGLSLALFTL